MDVEHGHHNGHFPFELVVTSDQALPVLDDGHIETSAADIGMQDPFEAAQLRQIASIGDASGRTGFEHVLGMLASELCRHNAAAALEDQ
ncbi:hypothetical protein D3C76_967330 [compost metagenome]